MNIFDIIIAIPLLWGFWQGFSKGLISAVASIVALLLGIWGGINFSSFTASFLANNLESTSQYNSIIAFSITFIVIVIAIHLLAFVLNKLFEAIALGFIIKIAGGVFGAGKYVLIVSVLLSIYGVINTGYRFTPQETIESSLLYRPISKVAPAIFSYFDFENLGKAI